MYFKIQFGSITPIVKVSTTNRTKSPILLFISLHHTSILTYNAACTQDQV